MCVLVHFASRDNRGNTTFIGGSGRNGVTWQLSVDDAILAIESKEWYFFAQAPSLEITVLLVLERNGKKFLLSSPDNVTTNNLDFLPPLRSPTGGAWPPWPLSIVGILPSKRLLVNRVLFMDRVTMQMVTVEPPAVTDMGDRWKWDVDLKGRGRDHRTIVVDVQIPWPATYYLYNDQSTLMRGFRQSELTPAKRDELEAAGLDYFGWDFGPTALENGGPSRITEIRFAFKVRQKFWDQSSFLVGVGFNTLNAVARGMGVGGADTQLRLELAPAQPNPNPDPDPDPEVVAPNVVGETVERATAILTEKGFFVFVFASDLANGPPFVDWIVDTQNPAAGAKVRGKKPSAWVYASPTGRRVGAQAVASVHPSSHSTTQAFVPIRSVDSLDNNP